MEDFGRALDRLYRKNVQSNVLEFRTHLPRYSLRAAAGKFLENQEITEEGWVEAPEDLRLGPDMFVAKSRATPWNRSFPMARCACFGTASQDRGRAGWCWPKNLETGGNDRYAVKRYQSEKSESEAQELAARVDSPGIAESGSIRPGISIRTKRNTASSPSSCGVLD